MPKAPRPARLHSRTAIIVLSSVMLLALTFAGASLPLMSSSQPEHANTSASSVAALATPGQVSPKWEMNALPVTYLSQGDTNWCFQASLAMVLRHHGKNVSVAEVARGLGNDPGTSTSLLDIFFGRIDSYLSQWPGFGLEHEFRPWDFARYRARIDAEPPGPVIASTFGLPWGPRGHTIVVVGYGVDGDQKYLYVHDPSGYDTEGQWGLGRSSYARVKWETFAGLPWHQFTVRAPALP